MLVPAIQFGFGLITTILFCAAAAVAAGRAPRHLLWLGLVAAGNVCATAASGIYLIFLAQMMKGNRSLSDSQGILVVQSVFGGFANLLILAGAATLLIFLLRERQNTTLSAQPWQDR